jgi:hypothetical protein
MCIAHKNTRNSYKSLVGKPETNKQFGRSRIILKRILKKWRLRMIQLGQDRVQRRVLVNMARNLRIPDVWSFLGV